LVNAIQKALIQTEKSNIHSILTDCPQRDERMAWMNDATVRFEETPYNFDIGRLFPKVVRDCMDVQDQQGAITCTAPFAFGARPADPVCTAYLMAGWQAYMHTGNLDILSEGYAGFKAWNMFLESKSENWIVNYSYYGDWAAPVYACQSEEYAVSAVTPGILMSTGYFYFNELLLENIARQLGKRNEAAQHKVKSDKIRQAFLEKWWDPVTAKVGTGSQGCQSFALWLDILPQHDRQRAADRLHNDLVEKGYRFTTGNLCTRYMMDMLARYGYLEDAWLLVTREEYPSYGFMIQQEATTIWERFELKKNPTMNSHNHPMYGAIGYWFYAYLAGVIPLEPGWKVFQVAPMAPRNLLSASAEIETPYGDITVRWVKRYGELHLYINVPHGTKAEVKLPGNDMVTVEAGTHHFSKEL
jgi:alpha-L-rhamnosidase